MRPQGLVLFLGLGLGRVFQGYVGALGLLAEYCVEQVLLPSDMAQTKAGTQQLPDGQVDAVGLEDRAAVRAQSSAT